MKATIVIPDEEWKEFSRRAKELLNDLDMGIDTISKSLKTAIKEA